MSDLRAKLLQFAYPKGVSEPLRRLASLNWDPTKFGGGPILSSTGKIRLYVADNQLTPAFGEAVLELAPGASELLSKASKGVRRMVDTDGTNTVVYLDDLHIEGDSQVMCRCFHHPSAQSSSIVLEKDLSKLPASVRAVSEHGLFARRTGPLGSWLWITEARYRGTVEEIDELARKLLPIPPAYWTLKSRVPGAYIDGVEFHDSGTFDITPGFLL